MASSSSSHQNTTVSAEAMMKPPSPSPNSGNVVGEITVQHNSNSPQQMLSHEVQFTCLMKLPVIALFNPRKEMPHVTSSPTFIVGEKIDCPAYWKIQVSHDCWYENRLRTVSFYLWRLGDNQVPSDSPSAISNRKGPWRIMTKYKLEILGENDVPKFSRESGQRPIGKGEAIGWAKFALHTEVEPLINKNDNTLKVRATVRVFSQPKPIDPMDDKEAIVLVQFNGKPIRPILRHILLGASSELYSLIVSDGEIKSTVDLAGDDPDTQKIPLKIVNQMLVFLETGTCDALSASSDKLGFRTKLLVLAQMYSLERLKNATVASVVRSLTPSSAPVVAILLKKHGVLWQTDFAAPVNELKRYFRENLQEIQETQGFQDSYAEHHRTFTELLLAPDTPVSTVQDN